MNIPLFNKAYELEKPSVVKCNKEIPHATKYLGASGDKTFYMMEDVPIVSTKEPEQASSSPLTEFRRLVEEWGDSEDDDYQFVTIPDKHRANVAATEDGNDCEIVEDPPAIIDLCDDEDTCVHVPTPTPHAGLQRTLAVPTPSAKVYFLIDVPSRHTLPISAGTPLAAHPNSSSVGTSKIQALADGAQPTVPGSSIEIDSTDVRDPATNEVDDCIIDSEIAMSEQVVRPQDSAETYQTASFNVNGSEPMSPTAEPNTVESQVQEVLAVPVISSCVHSQESPAISLFSKSYRVIAQDHCYSSPSRQIEAYDPFLKKLLIRDALTRRWSVSLKRLASDELSKYTCPDASSVEQEDSSDGDSDVDDEPMEQTCYHCDENLASLKALRKHIASRHKYNQLICPHCFAGFLCPFLCNEHIREAHKQPATDITYACTQCDFTTNDHCSLRGHIDVAHKVQRHKTCSECIFKCTSDAAMEEHVEKYHNVRSRCGSYSVTNIQDLIGEEIIPLPLGVPISSALVVESVGTENAFHGNDAPSSGKPPQPIPPVSTKVSCPECSFVVQNLVELGKHIVVAHTKYKCPITNCRKMSVSGKTLKSHMRSHMVPECPICRLQFPAKEHAVKHVENAHPNEVLSCSWCRWCPFSTLYEPALELHYVVIHKLQFPTICPVCISNQVFQNMKVLLTHTARFHYVAHSEVTRGA